MSEHGMTFPHPTLISMEKTHQFKNWVPYRVPIKILPLGFSLALAQGLLHSQQP
jgi:hypothetical protein